MKKPGKLLLSVIAMAAIFGLLSFNQTIDQKDPIENYNNHCAGCHGTEFKTFVDRNWKFSNSESDIANIIVDGMPDYGMPGFAELFTDQEVMDLSAVLWNESKKGKSQTQDQNGLISISRNQNFIVDTIIADMDVPWGIEFLPDGDLLITERAGKLLRYRDHQLVADIQGLPDLFVKGQGGLLDIELHPDFPNNGWIYLSYSYPDTVNGKTGNTAIMRARLKENSLTQQEVIFVGTPLSSSGVHFGCGMEFDKKGYLYFSIGERGNSSNAQSLENHSGKIHRINDDGSIPQDNPFVNVHGAMPSIYSYGHRNPQGVAMHPETGLIWVHEHGPKGGDEINIVQKGKNFGWPEITFGINYNGTIITKDTAKVGMEQPFLYWVPSIAPCGMCFVNGDKYPGWKGDILCGSLSFTYLHRVDLLGSDLISQERLLEKIGRVRAVEQSPDGILYVAVERPGMLLRLLPVD